MHESASRPLGTLVTLDADLEREFEDRLRESSSLAVRVVYSVVRQRQDAEEVAQEAFAKAYSRFSQLRDRNSFRAWLVRMTWRLAIDRWRSDRRRTAREQSGVLESPDPTAEGDRRGERTSRAAVARHRRSPRQAERSDRAVGDSGLRRARSGAAPRLARRDREVEIVPGPQGSGSEAPMSCDRYTGAIVDHACGAEIAADAAAHLKVCAACSSMFDEQRRLLQDLDQELQVALAIEPSARFVADAMTGVQRSSQRRRAIIWWSAPVAAAAVLVLLALGSLRFGEQRPADRHEPAAVQTASSARADDGRRQSLRRPHLPRDRFPRGGCAAPRRRTPKGRAASRNVVSTLTSWFPPVSCRRLSDI